MSRSPQLIVLFVDGLDHGFVARNMEAMGTVRALCGPRAIHRVDGVVHSLDAMAQLLAGQQLDLFRYQGMQPIPDTRQIINWDHLLPHLPAQRLLWNRFNAGGCRVGLFELLGITVAPRLDGFCVTKNPARVGIGELYRHGLTHWPDGLGDQFDRLRERHGYPIPLRHEVDDYRRGLSSELADLSPSELDALLQRCGYHELVPLVEENLKRGFLLLAELLTQHPVDVLLLHTGNFDLLLHLFFGRPQERQVAGAFDRTVAHLRQFLAPAELLLFSDHGQVPCSAHGADGFVHRTLHHPRSAVVMGAGERLSPLLERDPPRDLTWVYRAALDVMGCAEQQQGDPQPPQGEALAAQLTQAVAARDALLRRADELLRAAATPQGCCADSQPEQDSMEALLDTAQGFQPSFVLLAANEVGLLQQLADHPGTPQQLAACLDLDLEVLSAVLEVLLWLGVAQRQQQRYQLSPAAQELLTRDGRRCCRGLLRHEWRQARVWLELETRLRRGRPSAQEAAQLGPRNMMEAMVDLSRLREGWLVQHLELSNRRHLLDLGGGPGTNALSLLRRHPRLRATVVDIPATLEFARRYLDHEDPQLARRVQLLERDLLTTDDLGGLYDCALVAQLLHGFPRAVGAHILRLLARHLEPGAPVCVLDHFKETTPESRSRGALFSINMLACAPAGQAYSSEELLQLMASAGLSDLRIVPGASAREVGMVLGVVGPRDSA